MEWATLAVAFGGNLPGMVSLVQGWLSRKPDDSHVEIAVGEHKLVLRHAPLDVQRAAIDEFYARLGQET
jgi:hypothetical protein